MSYIKDLDDNLEKAETLLAQLEECLALGYLTAADIVSNHLRGVLKSSLFCCSCAKRTADKKGIPYHNFKCVGGCVRGMSYDQWRKYNKGLWYIFHWTRLRDKRYDKDGRFLGNESKLSIPPEETDGARKF
jgi:hypothetical protein